MKRRLLTLFSFFFYISAIFAEKKDYLSFRITPEVGLMNGFTKEFVFSDYCKHEDNVESRLDWDIYNIIIFKARGDFDILDYVYAGVDFSIGVPDLSGYMQDYDWLNSLGGGDGSNIEWLKDDPNELTNYSSHDNHLEKYFTFTFCLGGNIAFPSGIKLTPFVAYNYDYIGFAGTDGHYTYKADNWRLRFLDGNVISYRQETNSFLTGLRVQVTSIPRTYLYSDFSFSPALAFTNAMDRHHLTERVFWDKFTNLWQLQANLRAQYIFNQNHSAGLAGFIQYIPLTKGVTSSKFLTKEGAPERGKWQVLQDKGGFERFIWSVSLSYSFSL